MDAEIVGESELIAGRKFLVTHVTEEDEDPKVALLSFAQDGKAEIVNVFIRLAKTLKDKLCTG